MTVHLRETPTLDQAQAFAQLPPRWAGDPRPEIAALVGRLESKVVVLDDDPTGTQTVHGIAVLTEWSVAALARELCRAAPAFYILTNTRSLTASAAATRIRDIAESLATAAQLTRLRFSVISRGDSTLRGHFPLETDILADHLNQGGAVRLLVPYFAAGGRYTLNDVHYVAQQHQLVPAGRTHFARDATFGYTSSDLRAWVEEKSGGRIRADDVASLSLADLRQGGPAAVQTKLEQLPAGSTCVVNATDERDLEVLVLAMLRAEANGHCFLPRTAASFVAVRCALSPRPLLTREDLCLPGGGAGLVVVGSYVPTTTGQLAQLLGTRTVAGVCVEVGALIDPTRRSAEIAAARRATEDGLRHGTTVVIYTSRQLVTGRDAGENLRIGQAVSNALIDVVQGLSIRPAYLLAKGGITSSDLATAALGVRRAVVTGQLLPGVPVWQLDGSGRWPDLPYIVFPGNVGGPHALVHAVDSLDGGEVAAT